MRDSSETSRPAVSASSFQTVVLFVCALGIILIGIVPSDVLLIVDFDLIASAREAAAFLRP